MDAGTLELVELDRALDFDHKLECEATGAPCNAPAAWVIEKPCCHDVCPYACDPHRKEFDAWAARQGSLQCNTCGAIDGGYIWHPVNA